MILITWYYIMILLVLDNTNIFLLLLFAEISTDFIKLH